MKVLLITHIYPPAVDGGSKVIFKFGQYLQNQGHQLLVLTTDCHSSDDFSREYHPVTEKSEGVFRLPVITSFHRPLKLFSRVFSFLRPWAKGPIFFPMPFFAALMKIRQFHPDLIVAGPLPTSVVLYANFINKITRAKLLINASFHSTDTDFRAPSLIKVLKSADFLWTLTDYETNYFHQKFQIPDSKLINVGNGIDQSLLKLTASNSSHQILFIGAFAAHKGIETLIDSMSLLPKVKLVIAGQTTLYYPQIKKHIEMLPFEIKRNVSLFISPSDRTLSALVEQSDLLVLPSTQESFGLVLLESWAKGRPVVVSDIPQLSELITKASGGLTFKPNDSIDLSQKIHTLLNSKSLRQKLGKNGFSYVADHYLWTKIGESLCSKIGC